MHQMLFCSQPAVIITALALGVACGAQDVPPPAAPPSSAPASLAAPASAPVVDTQPALDPTIDRILSRLEAREVHDLRAKVSWKLWYVGDLEEDAQTRSGQIWYQRGRPVAKFLVHFTQKIAGNRRHTLDERHLFDGRWYVEMKSETKTFERREIRRPGDTTDPFKLGEGPFPVPFGQKKADILREFEVALVPPAEGETARDEPREADQLKLVPRPGSSMFERYKEVRVWVAREGPFHGLPVKVYSAKKEGTGRVNSYLTLTFEEIKLNEGFSGSIFELRPPAGYEVFEERLEPAPAVGDAAPPA